MSCLLNNKFLEMYSFLADLLTSFSFDFLFWSYTLSAIFEITVIDNASKFSVLVCIKRFNVHTK